MLCLTLILAGPRYHKHHQDLGHFVPEQWKMAPLGAVKLTVVSQSWALLTTQLSTLNSTVEYLMWSIGLNMVLLQIYIGNFLVQPQKGNMGRGVIQGIVH